MAKRLNEHRCPNGHRYFSKFGATCPDCGEKFIHHTSNRSILPVVKKSKS